ncbi:hypothetical protein F4825DRAFT_458302 [Nemania diffusa]|nr:hypothetical protein F4825DRAFT_458302 [Nemania diffusa]
MGPPVGLTHPLEKSACPKTPGLNRDTLYRTVRTKDPGGVITKHLISWSGSIQYKANDLLWNVQRQGWECYLCQSSFGVLRARKHGKDGVWN